MPITYEYECGSCGFRFERSQSINEEPVGECPKCGKRPHRLISGGSGFIMKGGDGSGTSASGAGSCCFDQTGVTCCGSDQRCGTRSCGG